MSNPYNGPLDPAEWIAISETRFQMRRACIALQNKRRFQQSAATVDAGSTEQEPRRKPRKSRTKEKK